MFIFAGLMALPMPVPAALDAPLGRAVKPRSSITIAGDNISLLPPGDPDDDVNDEVEAAQESLGLDLALRPQAPVASSSSGHGVLGLR